MHDYTLIFILSDKPLEKRNDMIGLLFEEHHMATMEEIELRGQRQTQGAPRIYTLSLRGYYNNMDGK